MMNWPQLLSGKRIRALLQEEAFIEPTADFRSEIEKDYGRAVFCTPVKRLQDKAQVFPLEPIDAVRTRLTHSLEVSSVAKSLCRLVARELETQGLVTRYQAEDIETIGATCGLLHDIGNPPFGHSGEDAIRAWFEEHLPRRGSGADSYFGADRDPDHRFEKDILHYEGNAQTIRLVSRLQVFSDRRGLNLTAAVFSALCKYTSDSLAIDRSVLHRKKLGHYQSESHVVKLVQEETGTGAARHPLAYLIEASDDICYLLGDLEDAIKKDVIRWSDAAAVFSEDPCGKALVESTERFRQKCRDLHSGKSLDEGAAQHFRVGAMREFVQAVARTFLSRHDEILAGSYTGELIADCEFGSLFEVLKKFSQDRIYAANETVRLEVLGYRVIRDLLDTFSVARRDAKPNRIEGKLYQLISHNYRAVYEHRESWEENFPDEYRRMLLICDYICGMTDTFAMRLHSQLTQRV
ncbi:MAG: dNTP triphosphohydrolase [Verrucomicrobiaceae bacterium]|nr:MAG: dNTP triphosphohydrolase [Verrucomicrobiaceae bacterium]